MPLPMSPSMRVRTAIVTVIVSVAGLFIFQNCGGFKASDLAGESAIQNSTALPQGSSSSSSSSGGGSTQLASIIQELEQYEEQIQSVGTESLGTSVQQLQATVVQDLSTTITALQAGEISTGFESLQNLLQEVESFDTNGMPSEVATLQSQIDSELTGIMSELQSI
jgi:hypothetical protein